MTRNRLILLAAGGSLAILLSAMAFEFFGDLVPCKLCIWQRWPHGIAVAIGLVAILAGGALLPLLGMLAALSTAGIGVYHTGVERKWWEGPTSCTSGAIDGLSTEDLMNQIMSAPLVQCDQVTWEMFGLSMASWNALISVGLAAIWLLAALKSRA